MAPEPDPLPGSGAIVAPSAVLSRCARGLKRWAQKPNSAAAIASTASGGPVTSTSATRCRPDR